ncbi:methyl-accepting chemotaxis protein [Cytobacillus spongiae]|uniref:methyl-accepting chemotaxis protein n=1 Tax=Cytobacillus spongiae TaxID=2901381 RepID=UPI001F193A04|nr:methyl-accepting chemotaxis protein [Cytobacillus spongiae]UII55604.1 methyl-accepting chemotaxis protein [Cytobacillus spongiae]
MKLRIRLLMLGLIPLVFSTMIIGFMLILLLTVSSSAKDDVNILLKVEELQGNLNQARQGLSNYTYISSDANKAEALNKLAQIEANMDELSSLLKEDDHKQIFLKAEEKFTVLTKEAQSAFQAADSPIIKRESIRIAGIENDVYLLDQQTNKWYNELLAKGEQKLRFIVQFSIVASILLISISVASSILLAKRITKPVNQIVEQAVKVANGDLSVQVDTNKVKKNSQYEVDQLKLAFANMVENLRGTVQSIEQVGVRVTSFSHEVSDYMENLKESSNQVAVSTDELARGSQSISEDIQSTASLMTRMNDDFEHVQQKSEDSLAAGQNAILSIDGGKISLTKQAEIAHQLATSSDDIQSSVEKFAQYTSQIETAAHAVREIADQTNLLALNAAIEAARAGEAGKGFAVVAEEVRKLADDSTKATQSITEMVSNIKHGISTIVELTELGHHLSKQQSVSMEDTEKSFEIISSEVNAITSQLHTLVGDMKNSSDKSQQVVAAIENISAITEQTAAGTEEISASTEAQLRSFEQVSGKVAQLQDMAREMKVELERFKLK